MAAKTDDEDAGTMNTGIASFNLGFVLHLIDVPDSGPT
jgi:hypothetical protein